MANDLVTRHIPSSRAYPGLLAHKLDDTREIVVLGDCDEARRVLAEAVAARSNNPNPL